MKIEEGKRYLVEYVAEHSGFFRNKTITNTKDYTYANLTYGNGNANPPDGAIFYSETTNEETMHLGADFLNTGGFGSWLRLDKDCIYPNTKKVRFTEV